MIHAVGQALGARRPLIPSPELLRETIDSVVDARMTGLADRVTITQTWRDLVLPREQHASLVELVSRVRDRSRVYEEWGFGAKVGKGLGIAALMSGPPGTGKTMAAGAPRAAGGSREENRPHASSRRGEHEPSVPRVRRLRQPV